MKYLHKFNDIVTNDPRFTEAMKGLCSYKSTVRMKKNSENKYEFLGNMIFFGLV